MKDIFKYIKKNYSAEKSILLCCFFVLIIFGSCEKLVDVPAPTGDISEDNVYTTDGTAISVLNGIYSSMNSPVHPFTGEVSLSMLCGLSADELTLYSGNTNQRDRRYYTNDLIENGLFSAGSESWSILYNYIFRCNAGLKGLTESDQLTPIIKSRLLGEAKFMRAFFYFYLVNIFGDVPLVLGTDPKVNTLLPRSPKDKIYQQVIQDLKDAEELLPTDYLKADLLNTTIERVRPTTWAAKALLARVYLYTGDFINAEIQSTAVINNSSAYNLSSINEVFLKNSSEAIWQLQPTQASYNTQDAKIFILTSSGPESALIRGTYLSPQLLTAFEAGDQRGTIGNWVDSVSVAGIDYYFPFKYKINQSNADITGVDGAQYMTEYLMILRLAEQYLIRAEARAQLNNVSGSQNDLNTVRNRAGLPNTSATDLPSLLTAILHERQTEFFTEWGHRWFDLKRTDHIDAIMNEVTPLKGGSWETTDQLYPLPLIELQKAPNLIQNVGY